MNIKLVRSFDKYVLSVLCLILGLVSKLFPKKLKKNKILVLKIWAIGDSVVSLPMIRGLRKNFPKSKIDVLAHKRNIDAYRQNQDVNKLIEFKFVNILKLFRRYDLCIDTEPYLNISAIVSFWCGTYRVGFSHGIRSLVYTKTTLFNKKQHMVQNYLDMIRTVGAKYNTDRLVKLETTKQEKAAVEKFLKKSKVSKKDFLVGITPGVAESVKTRMWPLERMAELADKIIEKCRAKVILIDSPANKDAVYQITLVMKNKPIVSVGDFTIRQVFYLIEKCSLFICNDTGPMHIAAAQGVKTIGLFGPNTPVLWAPYGKNNVSIYHPPWCSPCIDNAKGIMPECYNEIYQKCMKDISVEEVLNNICRKGGVHKK